MEQIEKKPILFYIDDIRELKCIYDAISVPEHMKRTDIAIKSTVELRHDWNKNLFGISVNFIFIYENKNIFEYTGAVRFFIQDMKSTFESRDGDPLIPTNVLTSWMATTIATIRGMIAIRIVGTRIEKNNIQIPIVNIKQYMENLKLVEVGEPVAKMKRNKKGIINKKDFI